MLGDKDEEKEVSGRRTYLRSVSWSDRSPNKPNLTYPRAQPSNKARSCLPPLQPLSVSRRNVEEWPKAGSDDLGVWPQQPTTPGGRSGCGLVSKLGQRLKVEVPCRKFESNKDRLAFFEKECSRILEHIYLGSELVAKSREVLRRNGITHVLNCVGFGCPEFFKGDLVYKTLWLEDSPSEDITSIMYNVFDYFEEVREQSGRVLVHCSQGVSRSASLVIAYIMWKEVKNFDDAFQYVKAARGVTNPNMGFACQLLQCQKRVHAVCASPNSMLRMYRMAPHSSYDPLHLVPKMLSHPSQQVLDSRGAFVVHIPSAIYVWIGKYCSLVMSNNARVAAHQVKKYERAQGPILTIKEDEEPSEFWDALPKGEFLKDDAEVVRLIENPPMSAERVKIHVGDRKIDDYDVDLEIFDKALAGGVVPPSMSSGSASETCLPARENGWCRLRKKFAANDIMKESSSPTTEISQVCEGFEQFVQHSDLSYPLPSPSSSLESSSPYPANSPGFISKSPASPSTSDHSSPFTFSPCSSNWSELSNISSQPSPSGLDFSDHLCTKNSSSADADFLFHKETSRACMEPFSAINSWKSSNICSSCKGISPSIAERRGSHPPTLVLQSPVEPARVSRTFIRSCSFSLPELSDEMMNEIDDEELKQEIVDTEMCHCEMH